jgi:hypothetical protein
MVSIASGVELTGTSELVLDAERIRLLLWLCFFRGAVAMLFSWRHCYAFFVGILLCFGILAGVFFRRVASKDEQHHEKAVLQRTTKETLTMDSPDKRPPKIPRIGDDLAQNAAAGKVVSNDGPVVDGPVVGSSTAGTGSSKTDSTMLPLPIASRIASFNVARTSQLARLRCVSRSFYRSLLDHTTSAGSAKHFIQSPASAQTHSHVYNFIDELTLDKKMEM